MHLTRKETSVLLPIRRKGTKYIARAASHVFTAVPVLIAVRDMLKIARTAAEVKHLIHNKLLKINGKLVRDMHESIKLFNLFEADKNYLLTLSSTGRFIFKETKLHERLCKVVNRRLIEQGKTQLNLHDGSNLITKGDIAIGDSVYLDFAGKMVKHKALAKGASVFVIAGKYAGLDSKLIDVVAKKVTIKQEGGTAVLNQRAVIAV